MCEREVREERLEGLNKAEAASLSSAVTPVFIPEPESVHRRRVEAAEMRKIEEFCTIVVEVKTNTEPDVQADAGESKFDLIEIDESPLMVNDTHIPLDFSAVVESLASTGNQQEDFTCLLQSDPVVMPVFQMTKRKPTKVPHSPLRHLRRITKLIKKA